MSDNDSSRPRDQESESDRALEELFAHAAPRPAPPAGDEAQIREAVYREWDAMTGRRVFLRRVGAVAATVAVIAGTALLVTVDDGNLGPAVARLERVHGAVQLSAVDGRNEAGRVGDALTPGTTVSTGAGQVAIRLADGGSLRLAPQTQLKLIASTEAELIAGALYFDSESEFSEEQLSVLTVAGTVRDVGTQFMVRVDAGRLDVGVRDGRVAIIRDNDRVTAGSGERLIVPGSAGNIRRDTVATFGSEWAWAESLAPPFDIDGRQLIDLLTWVAEQTGRRVEFTDPAVERVARETVLRGSIDLEPLPKLAAVLSITDLDHVIDGETIVIGPK